MPFIVLTVVWFMNCYLRLQHFSIKSTIHKYGLPKEFGKEDAKKEVERRKFRKGLDKGTLETFGDFVDQL